MGKLHEKYEVIANMPRRMSIDNMRNQSAKAALYNDCDYLVFYDDDVLLEKSAIDKLIESMETEGAGIAAGLTYVRAHPFKSMAFKKIGEDSIDHISWEDIENGPEIQEVDAIGFSLAAISTKVLEVLEPPYFLTGPSFTEDVYFCLKAKENLPDLKIILNKNIQTDHIIGDYTISHKNHKLIKEFEENVFEARTENSDFTTADIEKSINKLQTPVNT